VIKNIVLQHLNKNMPKKTIIIFITTFIIVGAIVFGVYLYLNRNTTTPTGTTTPWYQNFNPFGTGSSTTTTTTPTDTTGSNPQTPTGGANAQSSRFYQITDFAVAGATFLEDTRPIATNVTDTNPVPEQIKTIISPNTVAGRKDIQTFLNDSLSLNPPLTVDGNFGKKVTQAIKDFQTANNLTVTGLIDTETAPFFIKTTTTANIQPKDQTETVPSIRFVERMNGHIYKMFLDTKIKEKISNSTIPSIYEALFNDTGKTVVYRYLSDDKTINSFVATLGAPSGEFLPQNISDLSVSKDKSKYFYLTENNDGVTGYTGSLGDTKKNIVFNHPFTEWLSSWDANQNIYLTTKPSYVTTGSIFALNTTSKTIYKIFGDVVGLTTLISPKGSDVLYSTSTSTGPKLGIFNIKDHKTKDLDTYGLPEKCVWSNDNINIYCAVPNTITGNEYPDIWYQGLVSFDDFFVRINTMTGEKVTMANSIDQTPIDGTYLFLDKTENNLFFTNKKDSTLWELNLQ